jgi:hypothetical protein
MTDDDERRTAIWRLQQALGRGLITAVAESEPALVVAGNRDEGTRTVTVRCDPRASDGGRLWFWLDPGHAAKPLIEADNLADAVVHIHGERQIRETTPEPGPVPTDLGWAELS